MKVQNYAAPFLVVGCILFGLGSLIVKFVPVGSYASLLATTDCLRSVLGVDEVEKTGVTQASQNEVVCRIIGHFSCL